MQDQNSMHGFSGEHLKGTKPIQSAHRECPENKYLTNVSEHTVPLNCLWLSYNDKALFSGLKRYLMVRIQQ